VKGVQPVLRVRFYLPAMGAMGKVQELVKSQNERGHATRPVAGNRDVGNHSGKVPDSLIVYNYTERREMPPEFANSPHEVQPAEPDADAVLAIPFLVAGAFAVCCVREMIQRYEEVQIIDGIRFDWSLDKP
jgi:hypothetical protein